MAPPIVRGRRGSGRPPLPPKEGEVRRTQLISTYGVGSMIAFGERSFVVGGLDGWRVRDQHVPDLVEVRLQSRLGVRGFVLPPAPDAFPGAGVPVRLFPDLYTCPGDHDDNSHNLKPYRQFNSPRARNECAACGKGLTPSRFVVACRNGHLDEFPYWQWVHAARTDQIGDPGGCRLSYRTTGRSASLRSIIIACSCGARASMEGAFGKGALRSIGYTCHGGRPWLGGRDTAEQGCSAESRTMQRGSSAAWFPVVRSALSIPPFSTRLYDAVGKYLRMWDGVDDATVVKLATNAGIVGRDHSGEEVLHALHELRRHEAGERSDPTVLTGFEPADVIRQEEYRQLGTRADDDGHFECAPPTPEPGVDLPEGIEQVMLVKRLREVRVLQTFTRVEAPLESDGQERFAALSTGGVDWLPGVEVSGEGVFLRLDQERLRRWEAGPSPAEVRARRIRDRHEAELRNRAGDRHVPESPVRARLVLLHTLAHALINEWSLDAGYPASALRERLYVSDDMAGILIYTASSDSAGSLGGLVGQGELRRLSTSLRSAVERAGWCSADPLCMEAEAAGVDGLNLAACHSCVLLPETSCELNNTFLDRAMLVGAVEEGVHGYF